MTRGLKTLWCMRELLNPARHGVFAWMLFSHKLCRWLVPWALLAAVVALVVLAGTMPGGWWLGALLGAGLGLAAVAWLWAARGKAPAPLELVAFAAAVSSTPSGSPPVAIRPETRPCSRTRGIREL